MLKPLADEAQSSLIYDRGLHYGHGLFESCLFLQNRSLLYHWHLSRLKEGGRRLGLRYSETQLVSKIECALADKGDCTLKIILTAGQGQRGYASCEKTPARILCLQYPTVSNVSHIYPSNPALAKVCELRLSRQPKLAGLKHLNRLESVLAANELRDTCYQEGLLLDSEGYLTEAVSGNLFIGDGREGVLISPILSHAGVSGVMRQFIMDTQDEHGIKIELKRVRLKDLLEAKEVFVTNAIQGIRPIIKLETEKEWPVGVITTQLQAFLAQKWRALLAD